MNARQIFNSLRTKADNWNDMDRLKLIPDIKENRTGVKAKRKFNSSKNKSIKREWSD